MGRKKVVVDADVLDEEVEEVEEDEGPRLVPEYANLRELYSRFDFGDGIYSSHIERVSPVQTPKGIPCKGFLNKFPRPLFESDIERIYGGGKYVARVIGPLDMSRPDGQTGWAGTSKSFTVSGPVKMPPDFTRPADRPLGYEGVPAEGEGDEAEVGAAEIPQNATGGEVNTVMLSHLVAQAREANARAQAASEQLLEVRTHDPGAEAAREMSKMQTEAWHRQMEMQGTQSERFTEILATLGKGDSGASAQHYLTTIESMKTTLETMQRDSQQRLADAQKEMSSAMQRSEESHREDRKFLIEQYERREGDLREAFRRDLENEQRRGEDEVKRADRKVSEIRKELGEARARCDTLADQLSEARMQVAAGGNSKQDPLQQMRSTAEFFTEMKGLFGGSSGEDVVSRIFDSVESGALERTVSGVGARVASAWKGAGAAQPNPQAASGNNQAWEAYSRQMEEARQANARGRRRMRGKTPGQPPPAALPAEQQGAMQKAEAVKAAAMAAAPEGFLTVDGKPAQGKDLPLLIQRARESTMPHAQFAVILRPAIGGPEEEAMVSALDDSTALAALEGRIGGRLPTTSRQYMREVLREFKALLAREAASTVAAPSAGPAEESPPPEAPTVPTPPQTPGTGGPV